jgi:hypothetical protein
MPSQFQKVHPLPENIFLGFVVCDSITISSFFSPEVIVYKAVVSTVHMYSSLTQLYLILSLGLVLYHWIGGWGGMFQNQFDRF